MAVTKSTNFYDDDINSSNNTSSLTITITFSPNNYVTFFESAPLYCTCNEETKSANVSLAKGGSVTYSFKFANIAHKSDGSKTVNWSWVCNTDTEVLGDIGDNGTHQLPTIPRQATITQFDIVSTDLNNAVVQWNADAYIEYVYYTLDNGSNWTEKRGLEFTINELQPNTLYSIKIKVVRKDNGLETISEPKPAQTKDIARIITANNFNLGDSFSVNYSYQTNNELNIGIYGTDAVTPFATYRITSGGNYTFNFTDEELDRFYKYFGNNNQIIVRLYLRTTGDIYYSDTKELTVTLTGNQKTIKIGNNGVRRGKLFIGVNGSVKRGVMWIGDSNNRPRRCI